MYDSLDDDLVIQSTQLFNDAIATECLVTKYALRLENGNYKDHGKKKECEESFVSESSQIHHMTRAAVYLAAEFQEALDDYRKYMSRQKNKKEGKKGFKDL